MRVVICFVMCNCSRDKMRFLMGANCFCRLPRWVWQLWWPESRWDGSTCKKLLKAQESLHHVVLCSVSIGIVEVVSGPNLISSLSRVHCPRWNIWLSLFAAFQDSLEVKKRRNTMAQSSAHAARAICPPLWPFPKSAVRTKYYIRSPVRTSTCLCNDSEIHFSTHLSSVVE